MTIRRKLHLIIFLLVVAAGVIIGVMTYAWSSIDQESSEAALANQTLRSVFELNVLTYDLITSPGPRPGGQWRAAHRRLGETLDRIEMTSLTGEEVPLVKKLRDNHRLLADLFDNLAEAQRRRTGSEASPGERIIGQSLLLRSSLMSDAAFRLANLGSEDLFQRKRSAFEWVGVAVSMLAVVIGFILFVNRRIIQSVTLLQRGADAIGQRDFQHKIALQGSDELAHLAQAIGDMSAQIEKSYSQLRENEKRTRLVTDNMPALITYIDHEERYRFANAHMRTIGIDPETMLGRTMREVRGEKLYADVADKVAEVLSGKAVSFEGKGPAGAPLHYYQSSYIPDFAPDGSVLGFYSMTFDVTERKQAELRQAASEERLRTITDNLPALVCYIDEERRFQFNNKTYERWHRRPISEITGHPVRELYGDKFYAKLEPYLDRAFSGELTRCELDNMIDGTLFYSRSTYVPHRDESGRVVGVYGLTHDVTGLKRVEQQLTALARVDSLTGLSNRNQFNEKIVEAIAQSRRSKQLMALIFLDIDHFKSINDSLGHQAGDEVLKEVAQRLRDCVRTTDTVARLGGDEFVIILQGLHAPGEAQLIARKVIHAMDEPLSIVGTVRAVSVSIGIAVRMENETDPAALLRRADKALYMAKAAGRNTYKIIG